MEKEDFEVKPENKSRGFSWKSVLTVAIIMFTMIVIAFMHYSTQFASNNPEIGLAYLFKDSYDGESVVQASLLKQAQGKGNLDLDFRGTWTTKTVRELQKKDLTCIDEYEYVTLENPDKFSNVKFEDRGCKFVDIEHAEYGNVKLSNETLYYKCPLFNCERIEVQRNVSGDFIPESIIVTHVDIEGGIKGKE